MLHRIPKGVFDILPEDPDPANTWRNSHLWQYLEKEIRDLATLFGFREIRTPLFEATDLFTRSIGTETDIISKEMYTFTDKGGRSLSLRPEGTAAVMRACIEKHLLQPGHVKKYFYILPMFRYERQQAGRYRQHHQFGVEAVGSASPYQDAEVIHLLWSLYGKLGLKGIHLRIHSIGTPANRQAFKEALRTFLLPRYEALSPDSQHRFHTHPFRILDSKDPQDQSALEGGPRLLDFLEKPERTAFECVLSLLSDLQIPFQVDPHLVRGLDYYNNTVFEFTANELGAQNSLGGGGRYDGLLAQLEGPDLPACGFGAGLERILQTLLGQQVSLPPPPRPVLLFLPLGEEATHTCFQLLSQLRQQGLAVEMDSSGKKLKQALRYADSLHVPFVGIVGSEELLSQHVVLKNMETGAEERLPFHTLPMRLHHALQKNA